MSEKTPEKNSILYKIAIILFFIFFLCLGVVNTEFVQKKFFYPLLYENEIKEYASKNNVEPSLIAAIIQNESHFVASAVSSRGATGLMQIMPETGEWIAREMGWKDYRQQFLSEPEVNIRLGCWYLSELEYEFKNQKAAIAAYNAGRGQVREWLDKGNWDGEDVNKIPFDETRRYVDNVLADRNKYRELYTELR